MSTGEDVVRFTEGGLDWTVEAEFARSVREGVAQHLDQVEELPGVERLKRNMVRAVYRVPLAGHGAVIVKRYAVRGLVDWVKYQFKPSRAAAEWAQGRALDAAGVPTAVPLAMAERRRVVLRDAALVTREIPDALHLNAYVEKHLDGPENATPRAALYGQLAEIVRRMHDAGLLHNDLHGGNVLVRGAPDAPRAHVIDLHSVSRGQRERARWFDLAKLLHSMRTCSTAAERLTICRRYEEAGSGPSGTRVGTLLARGALSAELEPLLERMELRRVRSRTDRALGTSSRFAVSALPGYRVHHLRELPAEGFPPLVRSHADALREGGAGVLKDARRSALTRQTLETLSGARSVIVKQYRSPGPEERLKNLFRRPRALAAWVAGNGLRVRGFAAAEPLALLRTGRGPFEGDAYVVMEDLGDATRLDLIALARFAGALDAPSRAAKRRLLSATASLFRRLHAAGTYHSDLKAVNLFVREGGGGPQVVLADYDRVEFDRPLSERRRIKNLAQLSASIPICISLSDRLRFFREYAAGDADVQAAWKDWFRGVIAQCRRKIVVRMQPIE